MKATRSKSRSKVTWVKWWPLGRPVPKGWRLGQLMKVTSKHNYYQVLIMKVSK